MKKKNHTLSQMQALYADWQQSGLSKKAFCHRMGLTTSTFFYWIKKLALPQQDAVVDKTAFTQLHFSAASQVLMEIEYATGTRIKFYRQPESSYIKTLL
jgi:hypothetical protein